MAARMVLLAVLGACGFTTAPVRFTECYGALVPVCFSAAPAMSQMLTGNLDIDTDARDPASLCDRQNNAADYCVIAGTSFALSGRLTARGTRPLVLLSTGAFELSGIIDVGSHRGAAAGAGALPAASEPCQPFREANGSSGSYGGTYYGQGGLGGDGSPDDGAKGQPGQAVSGVPMALRGGCPGGSAAGASSTTGSGGAGGGTVALVAVESISINGTINASGAGGQAGGAAKSGGGGGGSGGMIVLDAPAITTQDRARLYANGGGGGQGGGEGVEAGSNGGESMGPVEIGAPGANPFGAGGFGGAGSLGGMLVGGGGHAAQAVGAAGAGGGGGGGGAGLIRARGVTGATVISPASIDP